MILHLDANKIHLNYIIIPLKEHCIRIAYKNRGFYYELWKIIIFEAENCMICRCGKMFHSLVTSEKNTQPYNVLLNATSQREEKSLNSETLTIAHFD